MSAKTYDQAVKAFVGASPWLSAVHEPALMALRSMAHSLDHGEATPALLAQFGLTYRALLKEAPRSDARTDDLEEAIPWQ